MSDNVATIPATPPWVTSIKEHFTSTYIGDHGIMITNMNADGSADDAEPVVSDFGDILPFLWYYGMHDFSASQLELAKSWLQDGLYVSNGRTKLFFNHDWLLGLLDLYRQSGNKELLEMSEKGARTIERRFFQEDLLIDEPIRLRYWRTWLAPASPFNGGYIELWLDIYRYTNNSDYLKLAERSAKGWINTPDFKNHGVFSRVICARSSFINKIAIGRTRLRARLFKDNTNLVWSILVLFQRTNDDLWKNALLTWLDGFEKYFWNKGNVHLMLDPDLKGYNSSIKAGFSSLDLLCDMHDAEVDQERVLKMATAIADFWLENQWHNGLFPEVPGGDADHLDANVDIVVGLAKLYAITHEQKYLDALTHCREAVLKLHEMPLGYCQSVDSNGQPSDARIKIKYQGLLTKLAILPQDPIDIFKDVDKLELLRDR